MVIESNLHYGKGIVQGNVFPIRRYIPAIPTNVTVSSAKLTVKQSLEDPDADAIFQLTATIEASGSSGTATIRFDLSAANTNDMEANFQYYFDIQLTMSNGDIVTTESGLTSARAKVTD